MLPDVLVLYICDFLDDPSSIKFLNLCKNLRNITNYNLKNYYYQSRQTRYIKRKLRDVSSDLDLPNYTTHIIMEQYADFSLDNLPKELLELEISFRFGGSNTLNNLPNKIRRITFSDEGDLGPGSIFDSPLDHLPESLIELNLGNNFDQSVDKLPENLLYLNFGYMFNKNVDKLPKSLLRIRFGNNFNQSVDHLPSNLEYLEFQGLFNQTVDCLPKNLNILRFHMNFNQPVDNLPINLKELYLSWYFNKPIDKLPENLKILNLSSEFNQQLDKLPDGLIELKIGSNFNKSLNCLPKKLKKLEIDGKYCLPLDNLPENLESLSLERYDNTLDNLPPNLESLSLNKYSEYKYCLDKLSTGLKKLIVGKFHQKIIYLPSKLEELEMWNSVEIKASGLKKLCLGDFPEYQLPESILDLHLRAFFSDKSLNLSNMPKKLRKITIDNCYGTSLSHISLNGLPDSVIFINLLCDVMKITTFPKNLRYIVVNNIYGITGYESIPKIQSYTLADWYRLSETIKNQIDKEIMQ